MSSENSKVGMVIVGGGQAGGRAALALRENGWTGAIDVICAEPHHPYERPVLSKSYLSEDVPLETFRLGGADAFEQHDIRLHLDTVATRIDVNTRTLLLSDGGKIPYRKLLIATGRAPQKYSTPGLAESDILYIRTIEDAERLKDLLSSQPRLAIVGAGYIGLEVAATAATMGCDVDVVEMGNRILARGVSDSVSDYVLARHTKEGVRFHLNTTIATASRTGQRYALQLANGRSMIVDAILAGIGAVPDCSLARNSGLKIERGVVVDEYLQTSESDIFAAGDVAMLHDSRTGRIRECQNWEGSDLQGALAARNMLDVHEVYDAQDWMWSDQFDLSIQNLGDTISQNATVNRHLQPGVMTFFLNKDNRLVGVSAIGGKRIGRSISICRRLIDNQRSLNSEQLADSRVDLKRIFKAT